MNESSPSSNIFTLIGMWPVLSVVALLQLGRWPSTVLGWVIVLVMAPLIFLPLVFLADALGRRLPRMPGLSRVNNWLLRRMAGRTFSLWTLVWVMLNVCVMLVILVAVAGLIGWLLEVFIPESLHSRFEAWSKHFQQAI